VFALKYNKTIYIYNKDYSRHFEGAAVMAWCSG